MEEESTGKEEEKSSEEHRGTGINGRESNEEVKEEPNVKMNLKVKKMTKNKKRMKKKKVKRRMTEKQMKFAGLCSSCDYEGELRALVGQHYWPYSLLSFTHTPPAIRQATSDDDSSYLPPSETADLTSVSVGVTLRWAETPFITSSRTSASESFSTPTLRESKGPSHAAPARPHSYRVRVWDGQTLLQELTATPTPPHYVGNWSVSDSERGRSDVQEPPEASLGSLPLDRQFKVTVEALNQSGEVTTALTLLLYTGSFHVVGGAQTTDGVSWCYSALQVRCPGGAERCVSPFWLCDGSTDCPDGSDEVGCGESGPPCTEGFRCWGGERCLPPSWRCDGVQDCLDGEDELDCPTCGQLGQVLCGAGGVCLPANTTCDGRPHCPDGWDESVAVCGYKSAPGSSRVTSHQTEVANEAVQDAEAICVEGTVPCRRGGPCVGVGQLCDGMVDCPAGEDEALPVCALLKRTTKGLLDLEQANVNSYKDSIVTTPQSANVREETDEFIKEAFTSQPTLGIGNENTNTTMASTIMTNDSETSAISSSTQTMHERNLTREKISHDETLIENEFIGAIPVTPKHKHKPTEPSSTTSSDSSTTLSESEYVTDDYNYEYNFGFDDYDYLHYNHIDNHRRKTTIKPTQLLVTTQSSVNTNKNLNADLSPASTDQQSSGSLNALDNNIQSNSLVHEEDVPVAEAMNSKFNQGIYELTSPKVNLISCGKDEFDCGGGWCVPSFWLCDGHFDCHEGEDEDPDMCNPTTVTQTSTTTTTTVRTTTTLPTTAVTAIPTSIPETQATTFLPCSPDEWRCPTGHCIPQEFFCDGVLDCPEGYDEVSGCSFSDIIDYEDYPVEYDYDDNSNVTNLPGLTTDPTIHFPQEINKSNSFSTGRPHVSRGNKTKVPHVIVPQLVTTAKIPKESESLISPTFTSTKTRVESGYGDQIKHENDTVNKNMIFGISDASTTQQQPKQTFVETHLDDLATVLADAKTTFSLNHLHRETTSTSNSPVGVTTEPSVPDLSQKEIDAYATLDLEMYTSTQESESDSADLHSVVGSLITVNSHSVTTPSTLLAGNPDLISGSAGTVSTTETKLINISNTHLILNENVTNNFHAQAKFDVSSNTERAIDVQIYNNTEVEVTLTSNDTIQVPSMQDDLIQLTPPPDHTLSLMGTTNRTVITDSPIYKIKMSTESKKTDSRITEQPTSSVAETVNENVKGNDTTNGNSPEVRISLLPAASRDPSNSSPHQNTLYQQKKNARIIGIPIKSNGFLRGISKYYNSPIHGVNYQYNRKHSDKPGPNTPETNSPFFETSISSSFFSINPTVTIAASATKDGKVVFTTQFSGLPISSNENNYSANEKDNMEETVFYPLSSGSPSNSPTSQHINTQINMNSYFYGNSNNDDKHSEIPNPSFTNRKVATEVTKNCTILIAVNGVPNNGKIPAYTIHGENGENFEYEVISVIDEPLTRKGLGQVTNSNTDKSKTSEIENSMQRTNTSKNDKEIISNSNVSTIKDSFSNETSRGENNNLNTSVDNATQIFDARIGDLINRVNHDDCKNRSNEEIIIVHENSPETIHLIKDSEDIYDNEYFIGNKELGVYQYDVYKDDGNGSNTKFIPIMYRDQEITSANARRKSKPRIFKNVSNISLQVSNAVTTHIPDSELTLEKSPLAEVIFEKSMTTHLVNVNLDEHIAPSDISYIKNSDTTTSSETINLATESISNFTTLEVSDSVDYHINSSRSLGTDYAAELSETSKRSPETVVEVNWDSVKHSYSKSTSNYSDINPSIPDITLTFEGIHNSTRSFNEADLNLRIYKEPHNITELYKEAINTSDYVPGTTDRNLNFSESANGILKQPELGENSSRFSGTDEFYEGTKIEVVELLPEQQEYLRAPAPGTASHSRCLVRLLLVLVTILCFLL